MKVIDQPKNTVYTSNLPAQAQYQVANTPQMMKVLSDSLYSDKIKAVIRELSTNAWDAHISANNTDQPFLLELPSWDNKFRLRDYGTGLSKENVLKVYQTYGATDKNNTNQLNGVFGLGSKSPFAVVDSFKTISYFNGTKYTFINSKNELNIPTIYLLREEPTDAPNGLEIIFETSQGDQWDWKWKTEEVFQYFPIIPKGCEDCNISKPEYIYEGDNWGILSGTSAISKAIMGWVAYPIDAKFLSSEINHNFADQELLSHLTRYHKQHKNNIYTSLLNLGIDIYFDIGEVEMDVSREKLQYHKYTIKAIKKKLDSIVPQIKQHLIKLIDDAPDLWEARVRYNSLINGQSRLKELSRLLGITNIKYKNHELEQEGHIPIAEVSVMPFASAGRRNDVNNADLTQDICLFAKKWDSSGPPEKKSHKNKLVLPTDYYDYHGKTCVGFYVNDLNRGHISRCKEAIRSGKYDFLYVVNPTYKTLLEQVIGTENGQVKNVSTLTNPQTHRKYTKKHVSGQYLEFTPHFTPMDCWTKVEIDNKDFEQGGFYVPVYGYQYIDLNRKKQRAPELSYQINKAKSFGLIYDRIIGVRSKKLEFFKKSPKWTNIIVEIQKTFHEYITNNPHIIQLYYAQQEMASIEWSELPFVGLLKFLPKIKNTDFGLMLQAYENVMLIIRNHNINYHKSVKYFDSIGLFTEYPRPVKLPYLKVLLKRTLKKYPLLDGDFTNSTNQYLKKIIKYIQLIERCNK